MSEITIGEILDDLRVAEEVLQKFERRYWITSEQFHELYDQGVLDNGEHVEDFCEWAGFFKLKMRSEQAFRKLSKERVDQMKSLTPHDSILLEPHEPILEYSAE